MNSSMTGQYAVRGSDEHSIKEILGLIEAASEKTVGKTKASNIWMGMPEQLLAEFAHGQTISKNMEMMVDHFGKNTDECPVPGECFYSASASEPKSASISESYNNKGIDSASLSEPSLGDYYCPQLN